MEITLDPKFREKILKKIHDREFGIREGIHQSDLNYCLNKSAFRRLYPQEDTEQETLTFSMGYATQRWLTGQGKDQPEVEVDGIKVTLDCVDGDATTPIPWELKATYASSNKPVEENVAWLRQIAAQCKVTGTTEAILTRLCTMGNWTWVWNRDPKPAKLQQLEEEYGEHWADHPTLQAYHIRFTPEEIRDIWAWYLGRRALFVRVLQTGIPLPKAIALPRGQEYECERCKYKLECERGQGGTGGDGANNSGSNGTNSLEVQEVK